MTEAGGAASRSGGGRHSGGGKISQGAVNRRGGKISSGAVNRPRHGHRMPRRRWWLRTTCGAAALRRWRWHRCRRCVALRRARRFLPHPAPRRRQECWRCPQGRLRGPGVWTARCNEWRRRWILSPNLLVVRRMPVLTSSRSRATKNIM